MHPTPEGHVQDRGPQGDLAAAHVVARGDGIGKVLNLIMQIHYVLGLVCLFRPSDKFRSF